MNRLTDNDKNWGPFTLGRWAKYISIEISSGDDEDEECYILLVMFGVALRMKLPTVLRAYNYKYGAHRVVYGISLSSLGEGFDFLSIRFGPQTGASRTERCWSKSLPWMMWDCVRHSIYNPDGSHFATEERGLWGDFHEQRKKCPASHFGFEDYDGEMITAACIIEEMEWRRGEGWFKWLRWFFPAKIRRSLDIRFSAEVGRDKDSWKGGTIGHGIDMLEGECPRQAFERYCKIEHRSKSGRYNLRFIAPCKAPIAA